MNIVYRDTLGAYDNIQKIIQGNLSRQALFLKQITNETLTLLKAYNREN